MLLSKKRYVGFAYESLSQVCAVEGLILASWACQPSTGSHRHIFSIDHVARPAPQHVCDLQCLPTYSPAPPAPLLPVHLPPQATPAFDAKGIETVRRDTCPAVAKMMETVLRLLFATKDLSQARCAAGAAAVCGCWLTGWLAVSVCCSAMQREGQAPWAHRTHLPTHLHPRPPQPPPCFPPPPGRSRSTANASLARSWRGASLSLTLCLPRRCGGWAAHEGQVAL